MSRLFRTTVGAFIALIPMFTLAAVTPMGTTSAAGNISVYVGYVDGVRAGLTEPAPWDGSPNTIFQGCHPANTCSFDAGALRISNNSGNTVTVDYVTVAFGTCVYDIWPHGTSVPDGGQLIQPRRLRGTTTAVRATATSTRRMSDRTDFPGRVTVHPTASRLQ